MLRVVGRNLVGRNLKIDMFVFGVWTTFFFLRFIQDSQNERGRPATKIKDFAKYLVRQQKHDSRQGAQFELVFTEMTSTTCVLIESHEGIHQSNLLFKERLPGKSADPWVLSWVFYRRRSSRVLFIMCCFFCLMHCYSPTSPPGRFFHGL